METYLDRIKLLKSKQKMTNEQLAEKSGIPLGTLSKLLAGMNDSPKLSSLVAICNALGCTLEYVVSGIPENTNNYTLDALESSVIETYRTLDVWGRSLVKSVAEQEAARCRSSLSEQAEKPLAQEKKGRVLRTPFAGNQRGEKVLRTEKRKIQLYELPVSAGVGVYLDEERAESISIPNTEKTANADYALRISGNSMEPKYADGDILLVQTCERVEKGELGIFLLDGCGFFKEYGGDCLISLNSSYAPIFLRDFSDVSCRGRVIGKLKRK